jgi:Nucleotidyl transferase of unknown function (DUF2204)
VEPELHADQERLYRDVLRLLVEQRIPHAVSGAFALQEHTGVRRPAKDLDIFLTSETAVLALDVLSKYGFRCEVCDPVWLAKAYRDDFFVDFITGMSNAAVTVTDSWITRARLSVILGVPTRILAAEELLASKMFVVRRERFDGADIAHIIYATRGRLDWNRILELAGAHWEMLLWTLVLFRYIYPAQSHYVPLPVWTQLVNQLVHRLLNPDPSARFRGSLVDENMFAIDVKEWGLDDLLSEYRACRARNIRWPSDTVEANEGAA